MEEFILCSSMSNQYCLDYTGFGVIFWDKKSLTSMIPMYSTAILYDTSTSNSTCNDDKDLEKFQFSMLATKLQIQYTLAKFCNFAINYGSHNKRNNDEAAYHPIRVK